MKTIFALVTALLTVRGFAADTPNDFPPQKPVPALTPAEELKQFQLPPGYHLELVLSEPDIKEPVIAAFDGKEVEGRNLKVNEAKAREERSGGGGSRY